MTGITYRGTGWRQVVLGDLGDPLFPGIQLEANFPTVLSRLNACELESRSGIVPNPLRQISVDV